MSAECRLALQVAGFVDVAAADGDAAATVQLSCSRPAWEAGAAVAIRRKPRASAAEGSGGVGSAAAPSASAGASKRCVVLHRRFLAQSVVVWRPVTVLCGDVTGSVWAMQAGDKASCGDDLADEASVLLSARVCFVTAAAVVTACVSCVSGHAQDQLLASDALDVKKAEACGPATRRRACKNCSCGCVVDVVIDVARLHGCTVARLHGCTVARLHGCTVARLHGCTTRCLFAPERGVCYTGGACVGAWMQPR